jgi:hypothetical protein
VFADGAATCGPKHAVLRQLAIENGIADLKLKLGVFRMSGENTPAVGQQVGSERTRVSVRGAQLPAGAPHHAHLPPAQLFAEDFKADR